MTAMSINCLDLDLPDDHGVTKWDRPGFDDRLRMEIRDSGCQVWCRSCACGDHYAYDAQIINLPHFNVVFRTIAEYAATNRGNPIGTFLAPILAIMEAAMAARDGSSVYFAQAGDRVKIGWSKKVGSRIAQLQTGSPDPIRLLGTMVGGRGLERRLHGRFALLRVGGEWFEAAPELIDFIAQETQ